MVQPPSYCSIPFPIHSLYQTAFSQLQLSARCCGIFSMHFPPCSSPRVPPSPLLSTSLLLLLAVAIQPLGECHICHLLFAILYEYVFILFGQNQLGDGAWTAEAEAEAVTGTAMGRAQARGRGKRYRVKHVHTKYCAGMWHAACGTDNGNGNGNGSGWR